MVLIACSLFEDKILAGTKKHTVRFRKKPPVKGDRLHLWWRPRTSERRFIGITVCSRVDTLQIDSKSQRVWINESEQSSQAIENFACCDGFESAQALFEYFHGKSRDDLGYCIWWDSQILLRKKLRKEVAVKGGFESQELDGQLYFPSNSSVGIAFTDFWCASCRRQKRCPVLINALSDNNSPHWLRHENSACCAAYEPRNTCRSAVGRIYMNREQAGQLTIFSSLLA